MIVRLLSQVIAIASMLVNKAQTITLRRNQTASVRLLSAVAITVSLLSTPNISVVVPELTGGTAITGVLLCEDDSFLLCEDGTYLVLE